MKGTFRLSKGETIQILVGQEGGVNRQSQSSGGGGGTFVVSGSNTPLIIAGGGGGIDILPPGIQDAMPLQGPQGLLGTSHGQEGVVDKEQRPLTVVPRVS